MRRAQEEVATFKAELGRGMEGGLLDTTSNFSHQMFGISAVQAQLEKEMSLRAEVGPELIRAIEDGMRIRHGRMFCLLTYVCSETYVRYPARQADCGHLRPSRSEGSNTKPHDEARESRGEVSGVRKEVSGQE